MSAAVVQCARLSGRRHPRGWPQWALAPTTLAGLAVGLWATNALAGSVALASLSVPQQLTVQFGSACAVLLVARRVAPAPPATATGPRLGAAVLATVGVGGTIALQYVSFATAPLVQANIVAYAWPLLVAAALALRLGSGSAWSLALAAVGFGGVALIVVGTGDGGSGGSPWGLAAAAGSAACMATYTLAAPRVAGRERGALVWATAVAFGASLAVTVVSGVGTGTGVGLLAAAYTGVGPMAAGYLCWTRAMASPSSRSLAPLAYATPLLSTVLLVATGHELGGIALLGAAVTLAAIVLVLVRHGRSPDSP